jgi:hypothetical protein
MLESIVEFIGGLSLTAVILLLGSSIVGSTFAALRAVKRSSAASTSSQDKLVDYASSGPEGFPRANPKVLSADSVFKPHGLARSPISLWKPEHLSPARKKKAG